jgi:hypothetical protein
MFIDVIEEQQMHSSDTSDDERRKRIEKAKQLQLELTELNDKLNVLKGDNNITEETKHLVEEDTTRTTLLYERWKKTHADKKEFIINGTCFEKPSVDALEKLLSVIPVAMLTDLQQEAIDLTELFNTTSFEPESFDGNFENSLRTLYEFGSSLTFSYYLFPVKENLTVAPHYDDVVEMYELLETVLHERFVFESIAGSPSYKFMHIANRVLSIEVTRILTEYFREELVLNIIIALGKIISLCVRIPSLYLPISLNKNTFGSSQSIPVFWTKWEFSFRIIKRLRY